MICDKRVAAKVKGKVYRRVVRPAMLFCFETVVLTKRQETGGRVKDIEILVEGDEDGQD